MTMQELFESPNRWVKGDYARSAQGFQVPFNSPDAACFCLKGGALRCHPGTSIYALTKIKEAITKLYPEMVDQCVVVVGFNDDPRTTFAMIQAVVKEAGV